MIARLIMPIIGMVIVDVSNFGNAKGQWFVKVKILKELDGVEDLIHVD